MHHPAQNRWRIFHHIDGSNSNLCLFCFPAGPHAAVLSLHIHLVPLFICFPQLFHIVYSCLNLHISSSVLTLNYFSFQREHKNSQKISSMYSHQQFTYSPASAAFLHIFFWWPWVTFFPSWLSAQNSIFSYLLSDLSPAISPLSLYL